MSKFGRLKKLGIEGKTISFELPEAHIPEYCREVPVLQLAHMGRANKEWFNARMVLSTNTIMKAVTGKSQAQAQTAALEVATKESTSLDRDRELIPAYVIVDWKNLYDDVGNVVKFSPKEAADLIEQLPDDIVDRLRMEAMDISQFRETPTISPAAAEEFLGNSQSG